MNTNDFKRVCEFMQGGVKSIVAKSIDGTAYVNEQSISNTIVPKSIVTEVSLLDPKMQAKIHENYLSTRRALGYN